MRAEYKRDMSHNYLILHGENPVDTSSYSGSDADGKCSTFYIEVQDPGIGWEVSVLL